MSVLISILLCIFSLPAWAGGYVIGNGGRGVQVGQQVFLYDLYMSSLETPYIGKTADPGLPHLPNFDFSYPKTILSEKLTDLNQLSSGLGDVVLAVIKAYRWVLVDFPLAPINDSGTIGPLPKDAKLVQIANRNQHTISINADEWKKLSPEHQVALMIHEALYSLVRPVCDNENRCEQSSQVAEELTALAFDPQSYSMAISLDLSSLMISSLPISLPALRKPTLWTVEVGNNLPVTKIVQRETPEALMGFMNKMCDRITDRSSIYSKVVGRPLVLHFHRYVVSSAPDGYSQFSVSVDERPPDDTLSQNDYFAGRNECHGFLLYSYQEALQDLSW